MHIQTSPPLHSTSRTIKLGLSASVLAGRTNRVPPVCSLVWGNIAHPVNQDPQILISFKELQMHLPFNGWRANPALGAMQEPIPDLSWFSPKRKNPYLLACRKSDHLYRWSIAKVWPVLFPYQTLWLLINSLAQFYFTCTRYLEIEIKMHSDQLLLTKTRKIIVFFFFSWMILY